MKLDRPDAIPFVRGFGRAHRRRRGGLVGWPGEDVYCDLSRALRFQQWVDGALLEVGEQRFRVSCVYRRLHSDGRVLTRIEVGLGVRRVRTAPSFARWYGLDRATVAALVKRVLALPVRVRSDRASLQGATLFRAGGPLSIGFLLSSTRQASVDSLDRERRRSYIEDGSPVVFVEYAPDEIAELPREVRPVEAVQRLASLRTPCEPSSAIENRDRQRAHLGDRSRDELPMLAFARLPAPERNCQVAVWFMQADRSSGESRDVVRRVRMHVFRLHAECDCLGAVLRLATRAGSSPPWKDSETLRLLERYLDDSTKLLSRSSRAGVEHDAVFDALSTSDSGSITTSERYTLLQSVGTVRLQVVERLESLLTSNRASELKIGAVNIHQFRNAVVTQHMETHVSENWECPEAS